MPARTAGRFFMWEEREDQRSQRRHLSHGVNVVCDVAWFWPASWIPLSRKISLILSSGEVSRNRIGRLAWNQILCQSMAVCPHFTLHLSFYLYKMRALDHLSNACSSNSILQNSYIFIFPGFLLVVVFFFSIRECNK